MKKIFLFLCALLMFTYQTFVYANPNGDEAPKKETLDEIVAVVNDDVITETELYKALKIVKGQMAAQNAAVPEKKEFEKEVLNQLINKKLQLQIAKQANIKVSDEELNDAVTQVAKQNNLSVTMMYEKLSQEGMSKDDYRNEIREQMTLQKLQQQEVISKVSVSNEEIERFTKNTLNQQNYSKEFLINDILIPLSDEPNPAEVKAQETQANEIIDKLKKGEAIKQVLAKTNQSTKVEINNLGWMKPDDLPSAFAQAVASLNEKEVVGPIKTPNGFHILNVENLRITTADGEVPDRKQIEQSILKRKFNTAVQNWVSKLRGQAFIVANR